jgi:hypothetical protein
VNATRLLLLAVCSASALHAQQPPPPSTIELPSGIRARVRTVAADGWLVGTLAGADGERVGLVPDGSPSWVEPVRVATNAVTGLELSAGRRRRWLRGLVVGGALGLALGSVWSVDPVACRVDDDLACSRAEAVGVWGSGGALVGAIIGATQRHDIWIPVDLDAFAPRRSAQTRVSIRVAPRAGSMDMALSLSRR